MDRGNISKGLFVVFEGLDGCGKTTQAQALAGFLDEHGVKYTYVREPGGTAVGNQLRSILLDPDTILTKWGEVLLLAAARAQLVKDVIKPALDRGEIVISDRYLFSSLAYQGYGLEMDIELIRRINMEAVEGLMPDWTILLDISPEVGLARKANLRGLDRIEQRDAGFFRRVVEGYTKLAEQYGFVIIDGTASISGIHDLVLTKISNILLGRESGDE